MLPNVKWIDDWSIGIKPSREKLVAEGLLGYFLDFWDKEKLEEKSKTTRNRYTGSLHALGGYLVERSVSKDNMEITAHELLLEFIGSYEGPLVYHNDENYQNELDMVCRKLYKYLHRAR